MIQSTDLYYFSPTGGTKKAAEAFASALAEQVHMVDLGKQTIAGPSSDVVVVAAPVYGGRLPVVAAERLRQLDGHGRKAVSLVVYGVRAYEDALVELNDILTECGFQVVAAGALIAEHSVVRAVGAGRPDAEDIAEIQAFAAKTLDKLTGLADGAAAAALDIPGNRPYKDGMTVAATPYSTEGCSGCGACAALCPSGAIAMVDGKPVTTLEKCMMCMACAAHCPKQSRLLPAPVQEKMNGLLGPLAEVRRANEFFL